MFETAPNNMLLQRIVVKHLRCCAALTNFLPLLRGTAVEKGLQRCLPFKEAETAHTAARHCCHHLQSTNKPGCSSCLFVLGGIVVADCILLLDENTPIGAFLEAAARVLSSNPSKPPAVQEQQGKDYWGPLLYFGDDAKLVSFLTWKTSYFFHLLLDCSSKSFRPISVSPMRQKKLEPELCIS